MIYVMYVASILYLWLYLCPYCVIPYTKLGAYAFLNTTHVAKLQNRNLFQKLYGVLTRDFLS